MDPDEPYYPETQDGELTNSEQQRSELTNSEQQSSELTNSEQQSSELTNSEQQRSKQQHSELTCSEGASDGLYSPQRMDVSWGEVSYPRGTTQRALRREVSELRVGCEAYSSSVPLLDQIEEIEMILETVSGLVAQKTAALSKSREMFIKLLSEYGSIAIRRGSLLDRYDWDRVGWAEEVELSAPHLDVPLFEENRSNGRIDIVESREWVFDPKLYAIIRLKP